jgi:hypothetical protein
MRFIFAGDVEDLVEERSVSTSSGGCAMANPTWFRTQSPTDTGRPMSSELLPHAEGSLSRLAPSMATTFPTTSNMSRLRLRCLRVRDERLASAIPLLE